MYEERRDTFSVKDILLQILLIILFVLILLWVFPSKGYLNKLFGGKDVKTEETTKIEASSDDINNMAVIYNQIFANNLYAMKEAAIGYYTTERLPQNVGDTEKMTLDEMYNKHLVLKLYDKDGNYCNANESYVSITKYDNEYQMKVNLSCGDDEDYIIVYLGCYDYCDSTGVCEKKVPVTPNSNPTSNPRSNPTSNPKSNPVSNPTSNPTSNPGSNPTSNPTSNPSECMYIDKELIELIFDSRGGSEVGSITFESLGTTKEISIPKPTRDGYRFIGWYADPEYKTMVNIQNTLSNDLNKLSYFTIHQVIVDEKNCERTTTKTAILYARWDKIDEEECPPMDGVGVRIINFETNGGSKIGQVSICKTCADASEYYELPVPSREGYTFAGWYNSADLSVEVKGATGGNLVNAIWHEKGCYDHETTIYAKWIKNKNYVCEYVKIIGGYWGAFGDWSEWSTTEVIKAENVEVETEVRKEVTGYTIERQAVGTKTETYVAGYEEVQEISGYKTEKYISGYTTEKKIVGYKDEQYISGYKEEQYVKGYNNEKYIEKYITEKYVAGQTTEQYISGYKEEQYIKGYNSVKYISGYTTQRVKVGTEKVQVGTTTKTTYKKVPAGTTKVYVKTSSGYVVPSNTSDYKYEVIGTKMEQTCSGCVTKTVYTWKEYRIETVYTTEKVTEEVPVYEVRDKYEEKEVPVYSVKKEPVYGTQKTPIYAYKTVDVYATRKVPVYGVKKVPVYGVKKTPEYSTRQIPVYEEKEVPVYSVKKTPIYTTKKIEIYGTREVTIYEDVKVSIYEEVTYYRYRSRQYFGGSSETVWSTCDPVDESLINDGFVLTGQKKEA